VSLASLTSLIKKGQTGFGICVTNVTCVTIHPSRSVVYEKKFNDIVDNMDKAGYKNGCDKKIIRKEGAMEQNNIHVTPIDTSKLDPKITLGDLHCILQAVGHNLLIGCFPVQKEQEQVDHPATQPAPPQGDNVVPMPGQTNPALAPENTPQ